jgi:hypothetical protein
MSPVAPRRQRTARTYVLALGGVALALGLAVGLFVFAIPSITSHNQTVLQAGAAPINAGSAKSRAADVARSGPILYPDQSGGTRDIFLQHLGTDRNKGWLAFDARKAGASRQCTLIWSQVARHFTDPCTKATVAADGAGLVQYRVVVDRDGDVVVDLNPNDENSGLPSGGTTTVPPSTTTTVRITGTVPKG